jgi:aldose 1-epimerase
MSNGGVNIQEWGLPGVYLFQFTNSRKMSLTVCNYGAAIVSCITEDRLGKADDVVLGYDDPAQYKEDTIYLGTIVGRYANRIDGASVDIDGRRYHLSATAGGFHHHGGAQGFNKKIFKHEIFELESKRGVKLYYTSADGEEGYPGNLDLVVTYSLNDENCWTVEYDAETDQPTILNPTQHAYFNLNGHHSGSVLDHYLQIVADEYLVVNEQYIPTGEIKKVDGTAYDLRRPGRLGDNVEVPEFQPGKGYDNTWVLKSHQGGELKLAAMAESKVSGRRLRVYTTEPAVHFYTGNFIGEDTRGKNGAVYSRRSGFCLETQHFPDSPHHPHFPSTVLLPGEKFYSKTVFSFSTDGGDLA